LNLVPLEWPRINRVAQHKAEGGLSYADCFVLALELDVKASIVTGGPEIVKAAEVNEVNTFMIYSLGFILRHNSSHTV